MKADDALDRLVDKVLAYRPKPKGKSAKKQKWKSGKGKSK